MWKVIKSFFAFFFSNNNTTVNLVTLTHRHFHVWHVCVRVEIGVNFPFIAL